MSIIPLISSWERYLDTHPTGDLREFGRWLQEEQPGANTVGDARHSLATNASIDTAAAATLLIARLHLINHFLSKPVIRKLGFSKDSEFSVLLQVFLLDKPNKKELCRQLLIENSTGVEITRRLAKKGLLRETADPNDRRSARLSLTEKGHRLLKE